MSRIGQLADPWKARATEHLLRDRPSHPRQVELHCLSRARDVVDAQDDVILVRPDVGEDPRVLGP